LEVVAEIIVIVPLLQITVEREKEHEAASFCLIASFGVRADIILTRREVRF
jgi:hypothetical protein